MIDGLRAEGERLASVMLDLDEDQFERATPCVPWTVRELLAHVVTATDRLPAMLAEPAPPHAEVGAAEYYRPDARFAPDANETRVATARSDAVAAGTGHALAERFDDAWRELVALASAELPTRVVRTRWGDAMLLTDFVLTRVVELAVHGLDLATALARPPWITPEAAALTESLLLSGGGASVVSTLGWDRLGLILKATGRAPLTAAEARALADHGVRRPTLG